MANSGHNHKNRSSLCVTRSSIHVDMDAVLAEVGHFGWYQLHLFILIIFPVMFGANFHSQYVFNAGDLKYRCFVPECEKPPGEYIPGIWGEWALIPESYCTRRKPIGGEYIFCERMAFSEIIEKCDSWVYETNDTIVAEFNLACKDWQRTLVGTIHSLGVFSSYFFVGIVSDCIGRRTTLILTVISSATMGLIRSFAPSYIFYVIFEYLDALCGAGIYSTSFVLVVEMVGKHRRVLCGSVLASVYAVGLMVLGAIAWAVPYWRTLTRMIYAPAFIFLSYFFFLSESVRWLISNEKREKAIKVLQKIAAMNGKSLSTRTINELNAQMTPEPNDDGKKTPVWRQVCNSRILITRVIICSLCWMTVTFVYYGLSINSLSLMGTKYLNYILTALFEIPGYALSNLMLDRYGRKHSIMGALLACSLLLFLIPVIPKRFNLLPTLFAKSCISLAFVSIYIFTLEMFPTNARHSLMSACSLVGRIGSISAPQTPLLTKIKFWLPYLLFGCLACGAATLMLFIPETLRRPMPDTVSQAENLIRIPQSPVIKKTNKTPVASTSSPADTLPVSSTSPADTSPVSSTSTRSDDKNSVL